MINWLVIWMASFTEFSTKIRYIFCFCCNYEGGQLRDTFTHKFLMQRHSAGDTLVSMYRQGRRQRAVSISTISSIILNVAISFSLMNRRKLRTMHTQNQKYFWLIVPHLLKFGWLVSADHDIEIHQCSHRVLYSQVNLFYESISSAVPSSECSFYKEYCSSHHIYNSYMS